MNREIIVRHKLPLQSIISGYHYIGIDMIIKDAFFSNSFESAYQLFGENNHLLVFETKQQGTIPVPSLVYVPINILYTQAIPLDKLFKGKSFDEVGQLLVYDIMKTII